MFWNGEGEVIVRLLQADGKIVELVGDIQSIDLEIQRDVQPIYHDGQQYGMNLGLSTTHFTIRGIARDRTIIEPPEEKVIRPTRWSDIMDEDF